MAPSAMSETPVPVVAKVGDIVKEGKAAVEVSEKQVHVHGGEGKTPLEAISHGPLIHPGECELRFSYWWCGVCCRERRV
jgi:hypothetical protein